MDKKFCKGQKGEEDRERGRKTTYRTEQDWRLANLSSSGISSKHVRVMNTPYTPLLYSKNGVYRGIHFFLFLL